MHEPREPRKVKQRGSSLALNRPSSNLHEKDSGTYHNRIIIGNRILYTLTTNQPHDLRIDFKDNGAHNMQQRDSIRQLFQDGPESDKFRLAMHWWLFR
ncbi:hypothetical protein CAPTEDRAFT_136270 [Capitella teleta]|uniref:Uncharacterized protein n=1 Tax=Capitella teleta TaxID=283909 RepID=R7V2P0_CAPTE|nr:hypothetical protein CAPTEDRAFT_136270 [Capitella teleta]|eukprot:ELU12809.1 hypothetical protein CAPTEDRAFT_136270 [Capitella teleta]